jgi:hypothetical protein
MISSMVLSPKPSGFDLLHEKVRQLLCPRPTSFIPRGSWESTVVFVEGFSVIDLSLPKDTSEPAESLEAGGYVLANP